MGVETALILGTGLKAYGQIRQGNAAGEAAKFNANVEYANARTALENAEYASRKGAAGAEKSSMETRATIGGIKAAQGASGVAMGGESATNVRASAAEIGALNALNIRANAAKEAHGYQVEAASHKAQGKMDKMQAHEAKIAGWTNAATTVLSAGTDPNSPWDTQMGSKSLTSGYTGKSADESFGNINWG